MSIFETDADAVIDTALADAYAVGKRLYPADFNDIDPEKKADDIYSILVGRPVYMVFGRDLFSVMGTGTEGRELAEAVSSARRERRAGDIPRPGLQP